MHIHKKYFSHRKVCYHLDIANAYFAIFIIEVEGKKFENEKEKK